MERGARVSEKNNYQNNIKHFRVREGLTQEELAKKNKYFKANDRLNRK